MTTFDIAMIVCAIGLPIAVGYIAFAAIGNIRMDRQGALDFIEAQDWKRRKLGELREILTDSTQDAS